MSADKFKERFKKYKQCKNLVDFDNFDEIFDGNKPDLTKCKKLEVPRIQSINLLDTPEVPCHCPIAGVKDPSTWEVFEFEFPKGLIFIRNPFTPEGQRYWIVRCLSDYPRPPHITNMDNLKRLKVSSVEALVSTKPESEDHSSKFYKNLRWITFGYHHDWDTKVYREDYKCEFPKDLALLTKYFSLVLGFEDFNAEAAIVNYYHLDSTLSGHQDRSEKNQTAPLFSISFGQTAVFLIGGDTKEAVPQPVYLASGDIVIMCGESRKSYHGVPKVLPCSSLAWSVQNLDNRNRSRTTSGDDGLSYGKRQKLTQQSEHDCKACAVAEEFQSLSQFEKLISEWSHFHEDHISKCRINLNVRQVLHPGHVSLDSDIWKIIQ